ncbi:hypothetical protein GOBAR_DD30988 [Gossypium barbadense]|nr:hypothetical protein GOBAR_DD30988 [Gossypium barbadense]
MAVGILEVFLVSAKGLQDSDFLGDMDPYVIIQYKGQERKSSATTSSISICNPFLIPGGHVCGIFVKDLFAIGAEQCYCGEILGIDELYPSKHSVVKAEQCYCGEIVVGATKKAFNFFFMEIENAFRIRYFIDLFINRVISLA